VGIRNITVCAGEFMEARNTIYCQNGLMIKQYVICSVKHTSLAKDGKTNNVGV
jgi:hypothetical protein